MATLYRREWETAVCEDERQIGLITSASASFHALGGSRVARIKKTIHIGGRDSGSREKKTHSLMIPLLKRRGMII